MKNLIKKKGFALISAIIIMVILAGLGLSIGSILSTDSRIATDTEKSTKAFYAAEAGIQHVIYKLSNDIAYRNNPIVVTGTIGTSSFSVTVSKTGVKYTMVSTGTQDSVVRKITQVIIAKPAAFNYELFARTNIRLRNSSTGTVNGDIGSRGTIDTGLWTVNGTLYPNSTVAFPTVDYASYEAIADFSFTVNFTFLAGQTYNGIYYTTRRFTVQNNVTINGALICEGNLVMQSTNSTINTISGMPSIVSKGNINFSNSNGIAVNGSGLIYTEGTINLSGAKNANINGAVLADNDFTVNSGTTNNTFTYNSSIQTSPPPYFTGITLDTWSE